MPAEKLDELERKAIYLLGMITNGCLPGEFLRDAQATRTAISELATEGQTWKQAFEKLKEATAAYKGIKNEEIEAARRGQGGRATSMDL